MTALLLLLLATSLLAAWLYRHLHRSRAAVSEAPRRSSPWDLAIAAIFVGVLLTLPYVSASIEPLRRARETIQARRIPTEGLGSGRLSRLLRDGGLLSPRVYDPGAAEAGPRPMAGGRRPEAWSVDALEPSELPSTLAAPRRAVASGLRVVSVSLPDESWRFLNEDPGARGLAHEVPGYVSIFDGGKLVFGSGVGVRVHGGTSRYYPPLRSFRLYFDPSYGAAALPLELLGWGSGSLDRLILDKDRRRDRSGRIWKTTGALAYEIARAVGALAPRTAPALLVVNGESRGLHFLVERVDDGFVRRRFGHDDFAFIGTRGPPPRTDDPRSLLLFKLLRQRLRHTRFDPALVEQSFDLDNLVRWWLANAYCANTDVFQGPLLRDRRDATAKWLWVNWDMDDSFMNTTEKPMAPWEQNLVRPMLGGYEADLRRRLLTRMWRHSRSFRERAAGVFQQALDFELRPEAVRQRVERYARIAADYGVEDTGYLPLLEEFTVHRADVVRAQLEAELARREEATADRPRGSR